MNDSNYIKIFSGNFMITQRIVDALKNIDIIPVVKDESESGRLAGFPVSTPGEQDIYVNKDELEKANSILENIKKELQL